MKRFFRVFNESRQFELAAQAQRATGPIRRGVGLIGRKGLPEGGGLIIEPCSGVVSFFMRFPIDVLFLNDQDRVCMVLENMVPWRASKMVRESKLVVELPRGSVRTSGTEIGDLIIIQPE